MRKNQFRKVTGIALAMAAAMALLAGCGSKDAANSASAADTKGGKKQQHRKLQTRQQQRKQQQTLT